MKSISEDFLSQFEGSVWRYPIEGKDTIRFQIEFREEVYSTKEILINDVTFYYDFLGYRMVINVWDEDETIDHPINTMDDLPFEVKGLYVVDAQNHRKFLSVSKNSENFISDSDSGEDYYYEDFNNLDDLIIYLNGIQEVDLLSGLKNSIIEGEIYESQNDGNIIQSQNKVPFPIEIMMPRLSDTLDGGTIVKWKKKCGDIVQEGEILAEIKTDKAVMEFESFYNGILSEIIVQEGEFSESGSLICVLTEIN